jgi:DNA-binding XRE family transcriptional regulator
MNSGVNKTQNIPTPLKELNPKTAVPVTLKDLRQAAQQTQEQLAATLGVGQDTISRLEKRSDMLLSTLRHYV